MAGEITPAAAGKTWQNLTWDDLSDWAGVHSLERGRTYQRGGRVHGLARTPDGGLIAWVQGTERYATRADLQPPTERGVVLAGRCSCPVGYNCKHAVAIAVEYLQALKSKTPVPTAAPADPRFARIEQQSPPGSDDEFAHEEYEDEDEHADDEWDEGDGDDDVERPRVPIPATAVTPANHSRPRSRARAPKKKGKAGTDRDRVRAMLKSWSNEALVEHVLAVAGRHPDEIAALVERSDLLSGEVPRLVKQARQEIVKRTAEEAYVHHWDGGGHLPEYDGLKRRLQNLFDLGAYDALLDLGRELLVRGLEQVGRSDDEGETASAIGQCLAIALRAVAHSSLPNPRRLLYVIDMYMADDYDMIPDVETVLDADSSPADWSAVADELAERLAALPARTGDDFSARYERDRLANRLIEALTRSDRAAEVLPLCEREVARTGNYRRLVQMHLDANRPGEAERWAKAGITALQAREPGTAAGLERILRDLAARRGDWATVAAYAADEFFDRPSAHGLGELETAAEKAGCAAAVKAAALRFLETGVRPDRPAGASAAPAKKGAKVKAAPPARPVATGPAWPLPPPFAPPSKEKPRYPAYTPPERPHFDVLLELALQEKNVANVLRWYDAMTKGKHGASHYSIRVADAAADTHPDRAIAAYKHYAEGRVDRTSPSAYEEARPVLRKLRDLLRKQKRSAEWIAYRDGLRTKHARKRRFLEVLDRLEGRPILDE